MSFSKKITKKRPQPMKIGLTASLIISLLISSFSFSQPTLAQEFEDNSIRVIRPRYFNKSHRLELGAELSTIMNEAFIYTFMATGLLAFHFTEEWAIEGSLSYGLNLDKSDKRILFEEFDIKTQILRVNYNALIALQWTPLYGKWQLSSGRLIYFDTFITAGGGLTGVSWLYDDFCDVPEPGEQPLPANVVKSYPSVLIGAGQRYFVSKSLSYRLDVRVNRLFYSTRDQLCSPSSSSVDGVTVGHDTITLQFGASYYF